MDLSPLPLFLAITGLAVALAFACQIRHQRALRNVSFLLALVAALLCAFELHSLAHPAYIRVDLLITIPALSVGALVVGLIVFRSSSGVGRTIALSMAVVCGATLVWFGWVMARNVWALAKFRQHEDAGKRLYWEETIRCQQAMAARFGEIDRTDSNCMGNLRVKSRAGNYPFTRVVVSDALEVYLLAALQPGAESVFIQQGRPMRGRFDPGSGRLTATDSDGASKLEIDLTPRNDGSCEARIDRGTYGHDVLQLAREELRACPAEENPQVRFVGAWSKTEALDPRRLRLFQIWLWRSQDTVWGLTFSGEGFQGIENRFNSLKRYKGKADGADDYRLLPYRGPDEEGTLSVSVSADGTRIKALAGAWPQGLLLGSGGQVSDPRIRLLPLRDSAQFAAYFDTVLDSADVPWTPR